MKLLNKNILPALLIFLFISCKKDFLEIVPKGSLVASTVNDYDQLLNGSPVAAFNSTPQMAMGDEMAAVDPYFTSAPLTVRRLFRYEDTIYDATSTTIPFENSIGAGQIYLYNKIINEVMTATDGTEQQKKSIQAEAMVHRAHANFMLINYFGKPYNAGTASTDPGYPIITEADITQTNFSRGTVQQMYDFILNDLTTALPNLPVQLTNRMRVSKAATEAFLARVYVTMGRFADALPMLNAAIANVASSQIPVGLYDYNITLATGGSFLPVGLFGPTYPFTENNQEVILTKETGNSIVRTVNYLVLSPATVALFGANDQRRKFFSANRYPSGSYPGLTVLRRMGPSGVQNGVYLPDLYLLRAECKARANDLAGAKADVEILRIKRMPAADAPVPAAIATNQVALVKFILEERIREFAAQGYRWFDMRRLSVDPVYNSTINYTHNLYSSTGTISASYTLRPQRFTLKFAQVIMDQNPGFENNP